MCCPHESAHANTRSNTKYLRSVGDAYDNALCESFFATLECELLDRHRFRTQVEAVSRSSISSKAGTTRDAAIPRSITCRP
jgi:hypothetical protein